MSAKNERAVLTAMDSRIPPEHIGQVFDRLLWDKERPRSRGTGWGFYCPGAAALHGAELLKAPWCRNVRVIFPQDATSQKP